MRLAEARALAKERSDRLLIASRGDLKAVCVLEWRAHLRMSSFHSGGHDYTVSLAPKRYEVTRAGVVVATADSREAALMKWEQL